MFGVDINCNVWPGSSSSLECGFGEPCLLNGNQALFDCSKIVSKIIGILGKYDWGVYWELTETQDCNSPCPGNLSCPPSDWPSMRCEFNDELNVSIFFSHQCICMGKPSTVCIQGCFSLFAVWFLSPWRWWQKIKSSKALDIINLKLFDWWPIYVWLPPLMCKV